LQLLELDDPQAGPGQIRVRVKAAGVQPVDCWVRAGRMPPWAIRPFPLIPGNEFAGVVDQVGEGVSSFFVGSEVLGFTALGCYAEYVVVSADQVVSRPAALSWEVAGGLSGAGQTAHLAMAELEVGTGDTVLINAAAGGVGTVAVQLARARGATVIGTASAANHEYLRSLGATPISYGDGLVERVQALAPNGVDAALDGAGGGALEASLALVANRDRILTLVEHDRAEQLGVRVIRSQRSAARLVALVDLCVREQLRISIRRTYPLRLAADAHREIESRHGAGKIVLTGMN
jgi:NADPH:quinone reductase-like Zn-dependent oxidoreductase